MKSLVPFVFLLVAVAVGMTIAQADYDSEESDEFPVLRKRASDPHRPSWTPAFPGFGNTESEDYDEYISTSRPKPERGSKRTSWAPEPTTEKYTTTTEYRTTTEKYVTTASKKLPWYKRVGHYVKDKYNYVSNKLG